MARWALALALMVVTICCCEGKGGSPEKLDNDPLIYALHDEVDHELYRGAVSIWRGLRNIFHKLKDEYEREQKPFDRMETATMLVEKGKEKFSSLRLGVYKKVLSKLLKIFQPLPDWLQYRYIGLQVAQSCREAGFESAQIKDILMDLRGEIGLGDNRVSLGEREMPDQLVTVPVERVIDSYVDLFEAARVNIKDPRGRTLSVRMLNALVYSGVSWIVRKTRHFPPNTEEDFVLWNPEELKPVPHDITLHELCRDIRGQGLEEGIGECVKGAGVDLWIIRTDLSRTMDMIPQQYRTRSCMMAAWLELDKHGKQWVFNLHQLARGSKEEDNLPKPPELCSAEDIEQMRAALQASHKGWVMGWKGDTKTPCSSDAHCSGLEICCFGEWTGKGQVGKCRNPEGVVKMLIAEVYGFDGSYIRSLDLPYGAPHDWVRSHIAKALGRRDDSIGRLRLSKPTEGHSTRVTFDSLPERPVFYRHRKRKKVRLYVGSNANAVVVDRIEKRIGMTLKPSCAFLIEIAYFRYGEAYWSTLEMNDHTINWCGDAAFKAISDTFRNARPDSAQSWGSLAHCEDSLQCNDFPFYGCYHMDPTDGRCMWLGEEQEHLGEFPRDLADEAHPHIDHSQMKLIGSERLSELTRGRSSELLGAIQQYVETAPIRAFSVIGAARNSLLDLNYYGAPFMCDAFEVRDQGRCDICWAFAATTNMAQRACILTRSKVNDVLSASNVVANRPAGVHRDSFVSSDLHDYLDTAFAVAREGTGSGVLPEACQPTICRNMKSSAARFYGRARDLSIDYAAKMIDKGEWMGDDRKELLLSVSQKRKVPLATAIKEITLRNRMGLSASVKSGTCDDPNVVPPMFTDGGFPSFVLGDDMSAWLPSVDSMMQSVYTELINNGPIAMHVNGRLNDYMRLVDNSVYVPSGFVTTFNHAVNIIGWGWEEVNDGDSVEEIPYWLIQDSHGQGYNSAGFYKAYRGFDTECWREKGASGEGLCKIDFIFAHFAAEPGMIMIPNLSSSGIRQKARDHDRCMARRDHSADDSDLWNITPLPSLGGKRRCRNSSVEPADCGNCICNGLWTGPNCDDCPLRDCEKPGMVVDDKRCECVCRQDQFGDTCSGSVIVDTCLNHETMDIEFRLSIWNLQEYSEYLPWKLYFYVVNKVNRDMVLQSDSVEVRSITNPDEFPKKRIFAGRALPASIYEVYTYIPVRAKSELETDTVGKVYVKQYFTGICDKATNEQIDKVMNKEDIAWVPEYEDYVQNSDDISRDYLSVKRTYLSIANKYLGLRRLSGKTKARRRDKVMRRVKRNYSKTDNWKDRTPLSMELKSWTSIIYGKREMQWERGVIRNFIHEAGLDDPYGSNGDADISTTHGGGVSTDSEEQPGSYESEYQLLLRPIPHVFEASSSEATSSSKRSNNPHRKDAQTPEEHMARDRRIARRLRAHKKRRDKRVLFGEDTGIADEEYNSDDTF